MVKKRKSKAPKKQKSNEPKKQETERRRSLLMERTTIPPGLEDGRRRKEWNLPTKTREPGHYMVELNLLHLAGLQQADEKFKDLFQRVVAAKPGDKRRCTPISKAYYSCS